MRRYKLCLHRRLSLYTDIVLKIVERLHYYKDCGSFSAPLTFETTELLINYSENNYIPTFSYIYIYYVNYISAVGIRTILNI